MDYIKATEKMLWDYTSYKAYIDNAKAELKEMEYETNTSMGIDYSKDKLSPTFQINSVTESEAERRIERKDLLNKQIELITSKLHRIDRALSALSDLDRTIIEMFYFQGKSILEIQFKVQYSEAHVKRKKKYAVEKISIGLYGLKNDTFMIL